MAQQKSVEAGASASEHRQAGSYLGRVVSQEQQGTQQEPRPEVALDLGPLGNFLLARSANAAPASQCCVACLHVLSRLIET